MATFKFYQTGYVNESGNRYGDWYDLIDHLITDKDKIHQEYGCVSTDEMDERARLIEDGYGRECVLLDGEIIGAIDEPITVAQAARALEISKEDV